MSAEIDKRIVEMQFDNKQFEKGIRTSTQSLDQFKKSLDLEKSVKGLVGLEKAGRSIDLSHISNGVAAISNRFSTLGIIGMRTLQNIADEAYNCGKRIGRALTIDPVKTGFAEYETQIKSVQTILANTSAAMDAAGYSEQTRLDIINGKLDELNQYADKTIYNFTEMTRNIGTFTAAGVDLETSVSSIKGIANLAAISGSTSQQASTAMYQLSQAISTGTVRLMDWNSVVNAGMGGAVFQNALIRTADNMGVVGKEAQEMFKKLKKGEVSFRDSLSSGWLSSNVLTSTLTQISMDFEQIAKANGLMLKNGAADIEAAKKLMRSSLMSQGYDADEADAIINLAETATDAATKVKTLSQLFDTLKESAQSGWTQTWEYIIGDFGEAKELLTGISDYFGNIINKSAESRNALMAEWKTLGGRNELINSFWNVVHSIENIVGTVNGAFREFFPPMTGQQLLDITKKVGNFTAKIKEATENSELMGKVSRVFKGAAAGLDILKTGAGLAFGGLKKLLGMSDGVANSFFNFAAGIGDSVVSIRDSIKQSKIIQGILAGLGNAATVVGTEVRNGLNVIGTFFANIGKQILSSKVMTAVGEWLNAVISKIPAGIAAFKGLGDSIINWVKHSKTLNNAWKNVKNFFQPAIESVQNFGKTLWAAVRSFFEKDASGTGSFWDKVGVRFAAFGQKMSEWFKQIKPQLETAWAKTKVSVSTFFTKTIPETFSKIKMGAVKKWPWLDQVFDFVSRISDKIGAIFEPAITTIKNWGASLWEGIRNIFGDKRLQTGEITFGEVMIDAISKGWEKIKDFFSGAVTGLFDVLRGIDWGVLLKTAFGIASLIKIVSMMNGLSKLGSGMSSIGKGLKGVGESLKNITKNGLEIVRKDAMPTALFKIAGAIAIIVASIVVLGNMEAKKAITGIGFIALILAGLVFVSKKLNGVDFNGDAILRAAGALTLLAIPILLLGNMKTETALKGLFNLGILFTELGLFMRLAGKGMNGKQSFVGLAVAINLLVLAVKNLGELDTGIALKGVIALGTIMLELSLFMNKTNTKKMTGLISMALSLNLLVRAVRKLGSLNTKTILKGVLGIAGIMAAFSLMLNTTKGVKLGSSIASLLVMAGSIILFIEAFKQIEGMNTDDMLKFVASIGTMMLSLSVAMKVISTIPITGALSGLGSFALMIVGVGGIITALGWLQSEWGDLTSFMESGGNIFGQIGTAIGKFVGGIAGGFVQGMNLPQIGTDLSNFMTNAEGFITGVKNIDNSAITGATNLVGVIGAIAGTEFKSWLVSLFTGENPITKFSDDIVDLGLALTKYAVAVLPMSTVSQTVLDRSVSVATALAGVAGKIPPTGGIVGLITGIGDLNAFSIGVKSLGTGLADFAAEISAIDDSKFNQTKIDAMISVATGLAALETTLEGKGGLEDLIEGTKSLGTFGNDMTPFGEGLNAFVSEIGKLKYDPKKDGDKMEAVLSIATSLAQLQNNLYGTKGLKQAILGVKSLEEFGTDVKPFAEGLNDFITEVVTIKYDPKKDGSKMEAVLSIATSLAQLQNNLYGTEGWKQAILGLKSLSAFGGEMPEFATGLNYFITQVSTLADDKYDSGKIEKALAVASAINDLNHKLSPTGGWVQGIMGTKDLGLLSTNIKKIGSALASFATDVSGIPLVDDAKTAVDALDIIKDFTDKLNPSDGLWDNIVKFFGGSEENTLLTYAENMAKVGTDLHTFSTQISSVQLDDVDKATEVITKIGGFFSSLTTYKKEKGADNSAFDAWEGWKNFFTGKNNTKAFENISTVMGSFGTNMGILSEGLADIDTTMANFDKSSAFILGSFKTFHKTISDLGSDGFDYNTPISNMMVLLDDFGSHLSAFGTSLKNTNVGDLDTAAKVIETLISIAQVAKELDSADISHVESLLEEYGKLSIDGFVKGFNNATNEVILAMSALLEQLSFIILNDKLVSAASMLLSIKAAIGIGMTRGAWYSAGVNLGTGLANGISAMTSRVRFAAASLAAIALSAIKLSWLIHSPSRAATELGMYFDLGLANGLDQYAYRVEQSATGLGEDVLTSAQAVLNRIGQVTDGIDTQPTIRPVIDLTDIENGMNTLDNMFSGSHVMNGSFFSGLSGMRSARALLEQQGEIRNQNGNRDVVDRLDRLSEQFDLLSEEMANIQIVLDSGVLVGQTSGKIDTQLGVMASRRRRGN